MPANVSERPSRRARTAATRATPPGSSPTSAGSPGCRVTSMAPSSTGGAPSSSAGRSRIRGGCPRPAHCWRPRCSRPDRRTRPGSRRLEPSTRPARRRRSLPLAVPGTDGRGRSARHARRGDGAPQPARGRPAARRHHRAPRLGLAPRSGRLPLRGSGMAHGRPPGRGPRSPRNAAGSCTTLRVAHAARDGLDDRGMPPRARRRSSPAMSTQSLPAASSRTPR